MLIVSYVLAWLLVAVTAGIFLISGYFNELTLTIYGFVISTLIFMGIVAVLPSLVDNHFAPKY